MMYIPLNQSKAKMIGMIGFLVLFLLVGCQKKNNDSWTIGSPRPKESIVVGIIHTDNAESGYSYAHDFGLQEAQFVHGLSDQQIIRKFNINDSDPIMVESAMRELIAAGANVIIGSSWGHMDICEKLATIYPQIIFVNCSGYKHNETNFTNYFGRIYQARYLSGIAAGMQTKSNKIGYVAAQSKTNSEVTGGMNAFALGVESVNPEAKIYTVVTYSWFDPALERTATQRLIAEGCDVIAQHCDSPSPQLEAEHAHLWGIGYNSDMRKDAPGAVITSVLWKWSVYYTSLIKNIIDGSFNTEPYFAGLNEGLVDISPLHPELTTSYMESAIQGARERIKNGFNIFEGEMRTNEGLTIGIKDQPLSDEEITGKMNWYYHNIIEL